MSSLDSASADLMVVVGSAIESCGWGCGWLWLCGGDGDGGVPAKSFPPFGVWRADDTNSADCICIERAKTMICWCWKGDEFRSSSYPALRKELTQLE